MYTDDLRDRFEAAAADCRAPYFDWAATPPEGDSLLPDSVGDSPKINVSGPAGTQTISNPLFTYDFKPPDPSVFFNVTPVCEMAPWASCRWLTCKQTVGRLGQHEESSSEHKSRRSIQQLGR